MERLQSRFTPEEEMGIRDQVSNITKLGMPALLDLDRIRNSTMLKIIDSYQRCMYEQGALDVVRNLEREVSIIDEISHRAALALELEGKHTINIFDRDFQLSGMGSLFDEGSQAFKFYVEMNRCNCDLCNPQ